MKKILLLVSLCLAPLATTHAVENPFSPFLGEWALKDDKWQQRWDGKTTETVAIENHHTHCTELNTPISVLCVVTAPSLQGHILWSFDLVTNTVHHLSSFGDRRNGVGVGALDKKGNLSLRVCFPSEGENTFREYRYTWVSENEYTLLSTQYQNDKPTGNFYGGSFVRINNSKEVNQ